MSYYTAAGVGGPSSGVCGGRYGGGNISPVEEESTDGSDEETEPARSFHRRLSTNRDIQCSVCAFLPAVFEGVICVHFELAFDIFIASAALRFVVDSHEFSLKSSCTVVVAVDVCLVVSLVIGLQSKSFKNDSYRSSLNAIVAF